MYIIKLWMTQQNDKLNKNMWYFCAQFKYLKNLVVKIKKA